MLPRLHVVTDDDVLARPSFLDVARALATAYRARIAVHLRGHQTPAGRLHALAIELEEALDGTGTGLLVADRVDVALATRTVGVRLGARSLPVETARRMMPDRPLACSVHSEPAALDAERDGANFLVLGTIWSTPSHPERAGAGPALVTKVAGRVGIPIVAIGGVTPERAAIAIAAGAWGVAVLSGIWSAPDPLEAAAKYLEEV